MLKNLSVIELCRRMIYQRHEVYIDVDNLEPDDKSPQDLNTFRMIQAGETDGLFQIESA